MSDDVIEVYMALFRKILSKPEVLRKMTKATYRFKSFQSLCIGLVIKRPNLVALELF